MQDYQNYPTAPRTKAPPPPPGGYQVLVEFANEGEAKPPTVVSVKPAVYRTREEALRAAEQLAFEYRPPDPWTPKSRAVYADGPDGFLTILQGAIAAFHYSSRVVRALVPQPLPDAPPDELR